MAQSVGVVRLVAVAADRASVGGVAAVLAVGSGHNSLVRVGDGTDSAADVTIGVAGVIVLVTQSVGVICLVAVATDRAGVGGVATVLAVGSGDNSLVGVGDGTDSATDVTIGVAGVIVLMTQSSGLVAHVAVATVGAGVGGVATVDTVGSGHNAIVAVTQGRDGLSVVLTARAGVGHNTLLGTGGSLGLLTHVLTLVIGIASAAGAAEAVGIAMTGGRNSLGVAGATTPIAGVGLDAVLHAGGSGGLATDVVVLHAGTDKAADITLGVAIVGIGVGHADGQTGLLLTAQVAILVASAAVHVSHGAGSTADVTSGVASIVVGVVAGGGDGLGVGTLAAGAGVGADTGLAAGGLLGHSRGVAVGVSGSHLDGHVIDEDGAGVGNLGRELDDDGLGGAGVHHVGALLPAAGVVIHVVLTTGGGQVGIAVGVHHVQIEQAGAGGRLVPPGDGVGGVRLHGDGLLGSRTPHTGVGQLNGVVATVGIGDQGIGAGTEGPAVLAILEAAVDHAEDGGGSFLLGHDHVVHLIGGAVGAAHKANVDEGVVAGVELHLHFGPSGRAVQTLVDNVDVVSAVLNQQRAIDAISGPHSDDVVGVLLNSHLLAHLRVQARVNLHTVVAVVTGYDGDGVVVIQVLPGVGDTGLEVTVDQVTVVGLGSLLVHLHVVHGPGVTGGAAHKAQMDLGVIAGGKLHNGLGPGGATALQSRLLHVGIAVLNNQGGAGHVLGPHLDDVVGVGLHGDLLTHLGVGAAGSALHSEEAVATGHDLDGVVAPQVLPSGAGTNLEGTVGDVAIEGGSGGNLHALAALVQIDVVDGGHATQIHHAQTQLIVLAGADAAGVGLGAGGGEGSGHYLVGQQHSVIQNGHATATGGGSLNSEGVVIVGAGLHVDPLGVTHTGGSGGSGILQCAGSDGHEALLVAGAGVPVGSVVDLGIGHGVGGTAGGAVLAGGQSLSGLAGLVLHAVGGLEQSHAVQPHLGAGTIQTDGGSGAIAGVEGHGTDVPIVIVSGGVNLHGLTGSTGIGAKVLPVEHELAGVGVDDTRRGSTLVAVRQISTLNKGGESILGISLQAGDGEGVPTVGGGRRGVEIQALATVGGGGIVHDLSILQEGRGVPLTAGGLEAAVLNQVDRIAQGTVLVHTEGGQLCIGLFQRRGDVILTLGVGGSHVGLLEGQIATGDVVGLGGHGVAVGILSDNAVAIAGGGARGVGVGVTTHQVGVHVGGLAHVGDQGLPGVTAVVGTLNGDGGGQLGRQELNHLLAGVVGVQHGSHQAQSLAAVLGAVLIHVVLQQSHRLTECGGIAGRGLQSIRGVAVGVGHPAPLEAALVTVVNHPLTETDQLVGVGFIVGHNGAHVVLGQDGVRIGDQALNALERVTVGVLVVTHDIQVEVTIDGLVAVVGGNGTSHARQLLTSHLVDLLHEVDHIFLGDTVHLATLGVEVVTLAQIVDLVLGLVSDGDDCHHVGVLGQHLAQRTHKALGVVVGNIGITQHLADHVPAFHTVVRGHGRIVEIDVPHHGHADLAAHIQQTAGIGQVLFLNADDVTILIEDDALTKDGAAVGHNVIAHGFQVVDFTVDLVGAVIIHLHAIPVLAGRGVVIVGHQIVAGQVVTGLAAVKPREPDTVDQTVALEDFFDEHLLGRVGPGEVAAHLGKGGYRHHGCQHQQSRQKGNQLADFHRVLPPYIIIQNNYSTKHIIKATIGNVQKHALLLCNRYKRKGCVKNRL